MMLDLKRSVVLVGMMGCGKTAIGSRIATSLEVPFIDLDDEIEKNEGMSIPDIFAKYGEPYFRDKEQKTIRDILNSKICILATGGGAFINNETRELIKKLGISIYIRASHAVLLERVGRKNNRPLLEKGNKSEILKELLEKRCPIYEEAEIIVDSSENIHEAVVEQLIEALSARI